MEYNAINTDRSLDWYNRYARHITLEEVGESGQEVLNRAKVLIIGAGGLGSPAALYLAAAGVGTLDIIDNDTVSLNNLQRQILHKTSEIGRLKVESAGETLLGINPTIQINIHPEKVTRDTIGNIINGYDLIIDGSDNFPTRYLVNDVCSQKKIPLVFGAVLQFSGQITTFTQENDCSCYRCLFPEAPDPQHAPTCEEAGIFGVITGIIGTLQASEALKIILNNNDHFIGETLKNRLLVFDGKETSFRYVKLAKNPDCPVCADPGFDFKKIEYVETCTVSMTGV